MNQCGELNPLNSSKRTSTNMKWIKVKFGPVFLFCFFLFKFGPVNYDEFSR